MSPGASPVEPPAQGRRAAVAFVLVTILLDMMALGLIIPVLPKLVIAFVGGDMARAAVVYGVFGTAWALMQFLCSPVLGALSDRFGRRPVILVSNLGLGLDYLLMATAPGLGWLFLGRVLSGITSASIGTAMAYIADVTPPAERASRFGLIGVAFGVGFVLGPALGGILGATDPRLPFWVAAALSLGNAAYGALVLPESLPRERRSPFRLAGANPLGSLVFLRARPGLMGLAGISFLGNLAHAAIPSTFVLYATHRYGWGERAVGLTLALTGAASAIVSGLLVGPAVRRFGERRALLAALVAGSVGFLAYGAAPNGGWFLAAVPIMALWGMAGPSNQSLMSRRVTPGEQGQLQGAYGSLVGIAGLFGPGLFAFTFSHFIDGARANPVPGAAFFLAGALLLGAAELARRVAR